MTDAELLALAAAEAKKTTVTWQQWIRDCQKTNYDPTQAHWYKAGAALEQLKHAAPPPPPPPSGHPKAADAKYVLFADNDVLNALAAPAKYKVALSADPEFAAQATKANVDKLRAGGHRVFSWCDCESTLPPAAIALASRLALDGWIGQAENHNQYSNAIAQWAPPPVALVGTFGELDGWQMDEIREYKSPPFIVEDFWNTGDGRQPVEPAISAYCAGIWGTSLMPDPTIQGYRSAGRWRDGDGLFHVASVTDWQNLP